MWRYGIREDLKGERGAAGASPRPTEERENGAAMKSPPTEERESGRREMPVWLL